jgi:hypothetical protein
MASSARSRIQAARPDDIQLGAGPIGEADRPRDAAPGEPRPQLVRLHRLEQPGRTPRCLRTSELPVDHHDRLAGQGHVQRRAEPERAGPDDDKIGIHKASVPGGARFRRGAWSCGSRGSRSWTSAPGTTQVHRSSGKVPHRQRCRASSRTTRRPPPGHQVRS